MIKWFSPVLISLVCFVPFSVVAQTSDGSQILLPLEAQSCNLPNAPAKVARDADLDTLKTAKSLLTQFQSDLASFRECLDSSTNDGLTEGNQIALQNAHNDSVEMETRIAEQFNVAICFYRQSKDMELSESCQQRIANAD